MKLAWICAALLAAGCATAPAEEAAAPAPERTAEEAAVLAAMDDFFDAMRTGDAERFDDRLIDEAMSYQLIRTEDGWRRGRGTNIGAQESFRGSDAEWNERVYDAEVLVRGPMAVVWVPYDFLLDGEFSHCGVNALTFIKEDDGVWRMGDSMWTVEKAEDCADILPAGALEP